MLFVRRIFDLWKQHSWQCVTVFFVLYFVLLIGGAAVFKAIEEPAENASFELLQAQRDVFLRKIRSGCNSNVTEADVDAFARIVLHHGAQKISIFSNYSTDRNWGFGQAVFFSGTILTTLGYAQTTYLTNGGKLFAILYICLGVPFTLFIFTASVNQVNRCFMWQKQWLTYYCPNMTDLQVKILHFAIVALVLWISLLLIPAAIFMGIEDGKWSYLDAFYYCFISMTTVGMTDELPGDGPRQTNKSLYKLSVMFYLYVGLIMVLSALRLFSDLAPPEPSSGDTSLTLPQHVDNFRPQRLKEERNALEDCQGNNVNRGYSSINDSQQQDGGDQST